MKIRRNLLSVLLGALLALFAGSAGAYEDGIYQDLAPGYGDDVIVTVTVREGRIAELSAKNRGGNESEYFRKAEEGLAKAIVEKQGVEGVDIVAGATGTSESILAAMGGALEQMGGQAAAQPAPEAGQTPTAGESDYLIGFGSVPNFRVGPGKDEQGAQVYSFNIAMASVLFFKDGRIADAQVDVYEVATPNYDGESMPRFSGWPGQGDATEEGAARELSAWRTKRERGDQYGMNPQNDWYKQMDAYEGWMAGKTVEELREWFSKYTSARNGRPLRADSDDADDRKALDSLTDEEKKQLADVVSMATMSLSDNHGLLLEAVEKAWENRAPVAEGAGR